MPRYTIDVDSDFDKMLVDLSKQKGSTKAQVIRDAVAAYSFLKAQSDSPDLKVSISNKDDKVIKDIVLP
jgi:hypothetical protein